MVIKKLYFFLIAFLIFSIGFVSAVQIFAPENYANITTSTYAFNISYVNSSQDISNPTNVSILANYSGIWTFIGNLSNCNANSCAGNALISNLIEGIYSINATLNNATASASIVSSANISTNVVFDLYPPNVVANTTFSSGYNISNQTSRYYNVNVSVHDNGIGHISGVKFQFFNGANNVLNLTGANLGGDYWNATLDLSLLTNGQKYNITIMANDTLSKMNSSVNISNIMIDNNDPNGTFSCSESELDVGEVQTCTCTGSDNESGVYTTSYTASPSTANTGPYTQDCIITDYAGNTNTISTSYTINSAYSATSSGGGGGGGSSSTIEEKFTSILGSVNPNNNSIVKISNKDYGIKEIEINVSSNGQNVNVNVIKYSGKPANVSVEKSGKVYKYLQINVGNIGNKLTKAIVRLRVEKSWMNTNGISNDNLALYKFVNGSWTEINTVFKEEDSNYSYFDSDLTSFSYFAISSKSSSTTASSNQDTNTNNPSIENTNQNNTANSDNEKSNSSTGKIFLWLVIIIFIVVIICGIILGILYYTNKDRPNMGKFK